MDLPESLNVRENLRNGHTDVHLSSHQEGQDRQTALINVEDKVRGFVRYAGTPLTLS